MKNDKNRYLVTNLGKFLIIVGNFLTVIGCLGIVLGLFGFYDMNIFSFGLSSGIRIVGSVAIAGCLLSAIGYGVSDFFLNN